METQTKHGLPTYAARHRNSNKSESSREVVGPKSSTVYGVVGLEGPNTLPERIYEQIREMILRAERAPGEKLLPAQLAEAFNVSVTPMREAFRLLEQANLVDIVPHKGTIVRPIMSAKQVEELYTVRLALEQLAIRLALSNSADNLWEDLSQAVEEYGESMKADDFESALMWDMRFHSLIVHFSGNEILEQIFEKLKDQIQILRRMDHGKTRRFQSHKEHQSILHAFMRRDEKRALEILENHNASGRKHVLEVINNLNGSASAKSNPKARQ